MKSFNAFACGFVLMGGLMALASGSYEWAMIDIILAIANGYLAFAGN